MNIVTEQSNCRYSGRPIGVMRSENQYENFILHIEWIHIEPGGNYGVTPPLAYVHGEFFGVGGVKTIPDNPRGTRSMSIENLCKGRGEWNTYDAVSIFAISGLLNFRPELLHQNRPLLYLNK